MIEIGTNTPSKNISTSFASAKMQPSYPCLFSVHVIDVEFSPEYVVSGTKVWIVFSAVGGQPVSTPCVKFDVCAVFNSQVSVYVPKPKKGPAYLMATVTYLTPDGKEMKPIGRGRVKIETLDADGKTRNSFHVPHAVEQNKPLCKIHVVTSFPVPQQPMYSMQPGMMQGGFGMPQPGMMQGSGGMPQPGMMQGSGGMPQPGMMQGGFGMPQPGMMQGGFGMPQPGMMQGSGGMPQPGMVQGSGGMPQPGMMQGGFGMPQPGMMQGGFGMPQPGMVQGGFGMPQPGVMQGSGGMPQQSSYAPQQNLEDNPYADL